MFENKTYENILNDMLTYVSDQNAELDTRTGSIIYNALAPIAMELETVYRELDMVLDETFLQTASKDYLVKHGEQVGVEINEATYSHYQGEFDVDLEIGSRFNLDKFNYNVIEKLSDPTEDNPYYTFELVCETAGSEPNSYLGDLTPVSFIANLSHSKLTSVLIYGEDEEDTEAYRYRILLHIKEPPINGNVWQYNEWLNEYDGVGKYKTIPCWNGRNTVKLTILNSENKTASSELIKEVQNYFDPPAATIDDDTSNATYPQGRGMGNGQAPIGAIVTVNTCTEVPVSVFCELTLNEGYSSPLGVEDGVCAYLNSLILENNVVAYMPIFAAIYNAECVKDVKRLLVNVGGTVMDLNSNPFIPSVELGDDDVAVFDAENSTWSV